MRKQKVLFWCTQNSARSQMSRFSCDTDRAQAHIRYTSASSISGSSPSVAEMRSSEVRCVWNAYEHVDTTGRNQLRLPSVGSRGPLRLISSLGSP